ncbi:Protein translocase subunit SecA OS=Streptomyces cyaneofuscatus OX=66883 GN=secA PE=3 SV=1 [Streptomyces cyaneofuscatus]
MMGRVHKFLGLTIGCIVSNMTPAQRREQYACDVTYGTNNEIGDYLRDNMARAKDPLVQRATTSTWSTSRRASSTSPSPLINPARPTSHQEVRRRRQAARAHQGGGHPAPARPETRANDLDAPQRTVPIHETGVAKGDWLATDNLYESVNTPHAATCPTPQGAGTVQEAPGQRRIGGRVVSVDAHTGVSRRRRRYHARSTRRSRRRTGGHKAHTQTPAAIPCRTSTASATSSPACRDGGGRGRRVPADRRARRGADPDAPAAGRADQSDLSCRAEAAEPLRRDGPGPALVAAAGGPRAVHAHGRRPREPGPGNTGR